MRQMAPELEPTLFILGSHDAIEWLHLLSRAFLGRPTESQFGVQNVELGVFGLYSERLLGQLPTDPIYRRATGDLWWLPIGDVIQPPHTSPSPETKAPRLES